MSHINEVSRTRVGRNKIDRYIDRYRSKKLFTVTTSKNNVPVSKDGRKFT